MTLFDYDWYDFKLDFGAQTFDLRSAEKFATADKARGRTSLPFGSSLWPAALVLTDLLAEQPELVRGKTVLELGCGLGLCALMAQRQGAARVLATDGHPDMTDLFANNLQRNSSVGSVEYAFYDWQSDVVPARHQCVLASDVLYEPAACNWLAQAFERTLAQDGLGIVCDPGRPHAGRFVSKMQNRGYTVTEHRRSVPEHFFTDVRRVLDMHPTSRRLHRLYFITYGSDCMQPGGE